MDDIRAKYGFPSPHGDKFQRRKYKTQAASRCFRPLAGINFNVMRLEFVSI